RGLVAAPVLDTGAVSTRARGEVMSGVEFPPEFIANIMARRGRLHVFDALTPRRTALLVIDMQNAWLERGAPWEVPSARGIVPNINRLARALREGGGLVVWIQAT